MQQVKINMAIILFKNNFDGIKKLYFINRKQIDFVKIVFI